MFDTHVINNDYLELTIFPRLNDTILYIDAGDLVRSNGMFLSIMEKQRLSFSIMLS